MDDGLERLSRDLHRIIGTTLPHEQLKDLLALKPLSPQSLSRFFQTHTRIQLKKGQPGHILQALETARSRPAVGTTSRMVRSEPGDPDLAALATPHGRSLAKVIAEILREVQFDEVNRSLRLPRYGGDYDVRPFPLPTSPVDALDMKTRLRDAMKASRNTSEALLARRIQHVFSFFMFGQPLTGPALEELFGHARRPDIEDAFALGLFVSTEGQAVRMSGLSLFSRKLRNGNVIHLFADTPPHFEARAADQRVYAGADSYELLEKVSELERLSGCCVEMGAGSGIQLIAALKQHPGITRAVGKERDSRAVHVALFNAALNGIDDKLFIISSDEELREALDGHPIAFAMTNPPFIAMPARMEIDGEDQDLRALFPAAGWGGDDGLAVTKEFIETVSPLLAENSQMVIYSQFAGQEDGPGVFENYIQRRGGFRFAFEPAKRRTLFVKQPETGAVAEGQSQKVFSAGEIALSVARLIVAALMAKQSPARVRIAVRRGGPEDVLLRTLAARLEASYHEQGITHFHDGFAVLTRIPNP